VALLINARYRRNELAYVVSDAGLRAIVTTDLIADRVDFVTLLGDALTGTDVTGVVLGQSSPDGFVDGQTFGGLACDVSEDIIDATAAAVSVRSVAIMMYTSGTTALPKGCLLSHEAVVRTSAAIVRCFT
jgi:fatty-acyl-CoA synthase